MSDQGQMAGIVRYSAKFVRLFGSFRQKYGLDFDEIFIFFALGRLNYDLTNPKMLILNPANVASLAEFLAIPRETLRRKLGRLEEKSLVQRTSGGYVVRDMNAWRRLGDLIQAEAEAEG